MVEPKTFGSKVTSKGSRKHADPWIHGISGRWGKKKQISCQKTKTTKTVSKKNMCQRCPGGSYPLHQLRESIKKIKKGQPGNQIRSQDAQVISQQLPSLFHFASPLRNPIEMNWACDLLETFTWCPQKLHAVRAPQRWLTSLRFIRCRLLSQSAAWRCGVMQPWSATRVSECRGVCHIARVQGPQWLGP